MMIMLIILHIDIELDVLPTSDDKLAYPHGN